MSESKFSLIDLNALSEPACKLIDVVSNCIGTLYEPTRIRRKAKAEADAALILAEADAERQALLKRAAHRLAIQEARRQKNIESIIDQAIKSLPETVSSDPVDPDWVSRFFDECKDVSNEELQKIWGRLLSGEVASPGLCSRKTLTILKDLSPDDAQMFRKFCSFVWSKEGEYFFPHEDALYIEAQLEKYGMSYNECLHFEVLGLIHCKYYFSLKIISEETLTYFNINHICYTAPPADIIAEIDCYPLTKSGIEILKVANPDFLDDFYIDCSRFFADMYSVFLSCPI